MVESSKNKLIARNTFSLYARTVIIIVVSLYSSRVVLHSLGITDWGVYSVVGGFVSMFGLLNTSMTVTTQRFITYYLGKNENDKLGTVFCQSINIHFLISVISVIVLEIFGSYYIYHYLNVPANRLDEAYICFQISTISLFVDIMSVPYSAALMAHEHLKVYAIIEVLNSILKLVAASVIFFVTSNKLVWYSVFLLMVVVSIRIFYGWYCKKKFQECKYHFVFDKAIFKEMLSFASWITFSALGTILRGQAINMLLNNYMGVLVNAAYAIAQQVHGTVYNLIHNIQVAFGPQLIKSVASGDNERAKSIIYTGSKATVILLMIFLIPIIFKIEYVLKIWLETVPPSTKELIILFLVNTFLIALSATCMTVIRANGKIRNCELANNIINIITFILTVILMRYIPKLEVPFYFMILSSLIQVFIMVYIASKIIKFGMQSYVYNVIIKILYFTVPCYFVVYLVNKSLSDGFMSFIIVGLVSTILIILLSYFLYLDNKERTFVKTLIINKIVKH